MKCVTRQNVAVKTQDRNYALSRGKHNSKCIRNTIQSIPNWTFEVNIDYF